jgi:aspartate aminotransferase
LRQGSVWQLANHPDVSLRTTRVQVEPPPAVERDDERRPPGVPPSPVGEKPLGEQGPDSAKMDAMSEHSTMPSTAAPAPAAPAPASPGAPAVQRARVSRRIGGIAESATLAVDAKAKALKAAGRPVIGFGAGEPDFPTPGYVVEAAIAACAVPANHRYTPAAGLPELRAAVAAKTLRDSGLKVAQDQVLVTNGGKQAVYQAFATLVDPGDEVILPAPYWTTYPEAIRLAGGVPVEVFAGDDQGYLVTVDQLEAARTSRTKVLLFCSPSNPTGSVYSREQVTAIGEWALANGIWVITDEIYEHLTYDGVTATSMPVAVPALADTCVVLNGVAKTYAMTGWRVGWMIGPKDVIKAATNLQSHLSSNVANVSQRAAIAAVSGDLTAVEEMKVAFDRRRLTIVKMLNEIPGVVCPTPQGAFYVYPSVRGVLGKSLRGRTPQTSAELATLILEEVEVSVVPGEAFGPSGYLRLSYALGDDDLIEGVSRIQGLLAEAR